MSRLTIRLNDYQRERLKKTADKEDLTESELVRILIDKLIEGKVQIRNSTLLEGVDISGLKKIAERKGISVQYLIDAIVEQLNESKGSKG